MPKENYIRKKAIEELEGAGWITWFGPKIKFKQNDVFGIIDVLALKGKRQKNIQLTTLSNVSTKRKKITNFLKKNKVEMTVEIWGWNSKKKRFKREKINIKIRRKCVKKLKKK
ncbi:MAG: hypothetical protein COX34_00940 [Candidatus Nealsonbacteria bacterium CG23_combo_of_CG06-09_8_20_14_all_36_12]|uniref:Uncharacterized protein n=1 Tax=Candidatus Nealsonbacteria bacterium CG23_combo_of_CG06-09_8_20_14_all_36_12 TaxID=1974718 RepID=A0A2G9Z0K6_9BACT|nr:MAG: hypothetical protein COX34_00940 [Candidatus Nealsonbacteria bacterium CG23_combo_of_CG06-09_8_20_14_all_36_12]